MRKFFTISAIVFLCYTVIMIHAAESQTALPMVTVGVHYLDVEKYQPAGFYMASAMSMISGLSFALPYYGGNLSIFEGPKEAYENHIFKPDEEMFEERRIDPSRPMVALTFDDGPGENTLLILEILKKYDALATFFVIGNRVESRAHIVSQTFDAGHEILGHSWSHRRLTALSRVEIRNEILRTNAVIEAVTGVAPNMMRAPFGLVDRRVQNIAAELDVAIINWSVDTLDWRSRNADAVYRIIMDNVHDRAIILCHDIHFSTAEAMERVIPSLIAQGYQLVTVSELMYYSGKILEPGQVYRCGR